MIDTHCHLLPRLDDGPSSQADSVQMARVLAEAGVTRVLCTPHYSERYPTEHDRARSLLVELRNDLDVVGVRIELELAAELSTERALQAPPADLTARAVAGRYLVVELVAGLPPRTPAAVAARLSELGLVPVFAHPERWLADRGVDALDELQSGGSWLQVVAPSLAGSSSAEVWETGWELVVSGRADVVASDAHRAGGRRVRLRELADLLDARCGEARRRELLEIRPERLLAGLARAELAESPIA